MLPFRHNSAAGDGDSPIVSRAMRLTRQPMTSRPQHGLVAAASAAIVLVLVAASLPRPLQAQSARNEKQGEWQLIKHDCYLPSHIWTQRTLADDKQIRRQFTRFEFVCGYGSEILIAKPIDKLVLIPDLSIQVDVKAPMQGVQLLLRVVLPCTAVAGKEPISVMIAGPSTQAADQWETLAVGAGTTSDLWKLLQQQTWGLKSQSGENISLDYAYIDQIALNIYTQPGQNRVDVRPPLMQGAVKADSIGLTPTIRDSQLRLAHATQDGLVDSVVQRKGSVIEVGGQPFFARIVQHNGEPFAFLQSLGFNTIQLPASATDVQLVEARQTGVWLICPPPPSLGIKPIGPDHDRILAWSLGDGLGERELTGARQRAQEIRDYDSRRGRLVVVAAAAEWANYAAFCDALIVGQATLGGNFPLAHYASWLHECSASFGHSIPLWVDVDTETPQRLMRQAAAMGGQIPPAPLHHQQALFAVYEALSAGARGIRCRSRSRLDAVDPATRLRALTLTWLNRKLDQVEAWGRGGARLGEVPENGPGMTVTALKTNRALLLLVQRKTGWEHRITGDSSLQPLSIRDTFSGAADRAYLLAEHGLAVIDRQFGASGADLHVENAPSSLAIALTQDPQIIARLNAVTDGANQRSLVALHAELVRQWLTILQLVETQLVRLGRSSPTASGALNEAVAAIRKADELLRAGSPSSACLFVDQADQRLAAAAREMLAIAHQPFREHSSAPLLSHVCLLPAHWQLTDRLAQTAWQANGLTGGDFENLQRMIDAGWQNVKTNDPQFRTQVELSPSAAVNSGSGLKLVASPVDSPRGLPQQTPLEIVSPPVSIPSGHLVRVHGFVNVRRKLAGAAGALVIADNLGGDELALRVTETDGWREFVIYRATMEATELRIRFQLTQPGEVWLDEITIRTTPLP